jgi:hypothetical protein
LDRLLLAVLDRITRHAVRGLADQDPAGGRERLETRGRVDHVAGDNSLARARLGVERDERLAAMDRDPELELGRERVADRECGADGTFGVVLMCHRRTERGHDRVADELLDGAAESLDLRAYAFEVRALKRPHVLRIELFRLRSGADQVAEEDRHQLPLLARSRSGTISRGGSERRVLAEDLMLEPFERRPGLERELVGKETAALLVHVQRVGLPARAVEREHQLAAQALAERIRRHQLLQLRYDLGVSAELELRLDALLQRAEPQLLEALGLGAREVLVAKVGKRLAAEERERAPQKLGPRVRVRLPPGLRHQRVETAEVAVLRPQAKRVSRWARLDRLRSEQLPERRHVPVQRLRHRLRRLRPPQGLDQLVCTDHLAPAQQQQREQRPLLRPGRRQVAPVFDDLEGP